MNQSIYISYAWGDDKEEGESREAIVNEIEKTLQTLGIPLCRDKKEVEYKGNIKAFEERLGKGDYIIIVVSDKFLKSHHCMYEVLIITENRNTYNRIFPVILKDAKIYNKIDVLDYIDYWNLQKNDLEKRLKAATDISHTTHILDQLNKFARIANLFDNFSQMLQEMNTLSPELHRQSNFSLILNAIQEQIKIDKKNNPTTAASDNESQNSPSQNISDTGIVAGGNVQMNGTYVAGRDLNIK